MKTFLAVLLGVLAIAAEAQSKSARIEVKTARVGRTLTRNWQTDYGSYDRDSARQQALDLRVSTVGREAFEAEVEIFFHGRHPATKQMMVVSWQKGTVKVEPGIGKRYLVSSGTVESNSTRYAALGEFYGSGANIAGWTVRLSAEGKPLAEAHSGTPLSPERFAEAVTAGVKKGTLAKGTPGVAQLEETAIDAR